MSSNVFKNSRQRTPIYAECKNHKMLTFKDKMAPPRPVRSSHNVKIITRDGMVTLKDVVHTEDEKTAIGAKAALVVGADHVSSQLTIAASK
jgi:osmotically-inducible protein OsmY